MAKSREAFRTISEVSEWLDTPAHVLRFWESRFSQIKPVKRAGGRRYYRPGDMMLLGGIKRLLHEDGITIKGVQKILREKGVKYVGSLCLENLDGSDAKPAQAAPEPIAEHTPITEILTEITEQPVSSEAPEGSETHLETESYSEPEEQEEQTEPEAPAFFAAASEPVSTPVLMPEIDEDDNSGDPVSEDADTPIEPALSFATAPNFDAAPALDTDAEEEAQGDEAEDASPASNMPEGDRISLLYHRLQTLRDRVHASDARG